MAAFVCVDNVLNVIEKCIGNELHIVSSENRLNLHKILTQSLLASVVIEKYVSIYVQKKLECLSSALLTHFSQLKMYLVMHQAKIGS